MRPEADTLLQWIKPEPATPEELECVDKLKLGDYEIYSERLNSFLLEAREIFMRVGISHMLRSGDLIVSINTAAGDMVAASSGTYLHAVVAQLPIKFTVKNWLNNPTVGVKEGDIFYAAEALYGGIHNPDQMAIMPVFNDGKLVAWTAAAVHQMEIGASAPGGAPPTAKSRHEEGMSIPPMKVGENFHIRDDFLEMVSSFGSRNPRPQIVDTKARATACERLRLRVQELSRQKGNDFLMGLFRKMLMVSEQGARERIKGWNDGTYRAVVFGDTVGREESLIRFYLSAHKKDDTLTFDLTGTSPEHDAGSHHGLPHVVVAHAAVYIYAYAFHDLPISSGTLAPLNWIVPQGTVVNPHPEAAVSASPMFLTTFFTLMYTTFARMMFSSAQRLLVTAPTATGGGMMVAGTNQHGDRFTETLSYPLNTVGQGARSDMDGVDGYGFCMAHVSRGLDVEVTEVDMPLLHLFQKYLKDAIGFGKYRSGAGSVAALTVHQVPYISYICMAKESKFHSSYGLFGGYPPGVKFGIEIRNSDLRQKVGTGGKDLPLDIYELLTQKTIQGEYVFERNLRPLRQVQEGDVFVMIQGGTGGYGDVLERDPEKVMEDLRNEIISHYTAREVYHVAYEPQTLEVDLSGTEELRQRERAARKARGRKFDDFETEWGQKRPPEVALRYYGSWPDAKKVREIVRI